MVKIVQELKFPALLRGAAIPNFKRDIETTKFTESCQADDTRYTNEYYVIPNTNIVIKSSNGYKANGYIYPQLLCFPK